MRKDRFIFAKGGLTIAEVIIAMVIFAIVGGAFAVLLISSLDTWATARQSARDAQDVRLALEKMTSDIPKAAAIIENTPTKLSFRTDADEITYALQENDLIYILNDDSNPPVLVRGITNETNEDIFTYYDSNNRITNLTNNISLVSIRIRLNSLDFFTSVRETIPDTTGIPGDFTRLLLDMSATGGFYYINPAGEVAYKSSDDYPADFVMYNADFDEEDYSIWGMNWDKVYYLDSDGTNLLQWSKEDLSPTLLSVDKNDHSCWVSFGWDDEIGGWPVMKFEIRGGEIVEAFDEPIRLQIGAKDYRPMRIEVAGDSSCWVISEGEGPIFKIDKDGNVTHTSTIEEDGITSYHNTTALSIYNDPDDPDNYVVWVPDYITRKVYRYDKDLQGIGTPVALGSTPYSSAIDAGNGSLWVISETGYVTKINKDGTIAVDNKPTGVMIGMADLYQAIAVDQLTHEVWIVDAAGERYVVLDANGDYLREYADMQEPCSIVVRPP